MGVIHTREKVLIAFELLEDGLSHNQIRRELKVGKGTIQRWFSEPKMNPYLDDIAIERAVKGDMPVFDALTHFEREVVLRQLAANRDDIDFTMRFGSHANRVLHAVDGLRERDQARLKRAGGTARKPRPSGVTVKKRGPEFDATVLQLYRAGKPAPQIAQEIGASVTTVRRVLKNAA